MQLRYLKDRLGFRRGRAGPAREQWSLYKQRPFTNGRTSDSVLTDYKIQMEGYRQNSWEDLPIRMSPAVKSHLWLPHSFQLWSGKIEISSV